jgi:hypothetical protein
MLARGGSIVREHKSDKKYVVHPKEVKNVI